MSLVPTVCNKNEKKNNGEKMVVESTLKELDYALVSSTIALVKIFMRHNGGKAFIKLNLNFDAPTVSRVID